MHGTKHLVGREQRLVGLFAERLQPMLHTIEIEPAYDEVRRFATTFSIVVVITVMLAASTWLLR